MRRAEREEKVKERAKRGCSPAQAEVARLGESVQIIRKTLVVNMHEGAGSDGILAPGRSVR